MEKEKNEWIREYTLAGFVLISVILIGIIWTNTLLDQKPDGPNFYRATVQSDSGFYLTRTAEAGLGTLPATKAHKNEHTATPTVQSTATPILISPTEEVDQEN